MTVIRRLAVFNRLAEGPPVFDFPIDVRDFNPNWYHPAKYGSGGFTGERCMTHRAGPYAGRPVWFRLNDHEERLDRTIQEVEWLDVCPREARIQARLTLAALNPSDCYFSLLFGAEGDVGVYPPSNKAIVAIHSRDMHPAKSPYMSEDIVLNGMDVMIVTDRRRRRGPPGREAQTKLSAHYKLSNIVRHRAIQAGYKDGVMLDERGVISELSVSNLLLLESDGLVTPGANSSALNGITKQTIVTLMRELHGLPTREEDIEISRLSRARAIFATGTAVGLIRINRVFTDTGELVYQSTDLEATDLIKEVDQFYWHLLFGEESGLHPEWFTPVPEEILEMPEPLFRLHSS